MRSLECSVMVKRRGGLRAWPRSFVGGELTLCRHEGIAKYPMPPDFAAHLGKQMKARMVGTLEAASGLTIDERWSVRPFDCGDDLCGNPHHWRVVRFADDPSPELPRHRGFVQVAGDELDQIRGILANRRESNEPAWVIHRSHPERMYELIEKAMATVLEAERLSSSP